MTSYPPPPGDPNDPNQPGQGSDLPSYGSTPPPPGGGGGYPPPGGGGAQPGTNKKALWSMILGIVSILCCGLFAGIPAIILANMGKKEINASGGLQTGGGMATAGLVLGIISIGLTILSVILYATGALTFSAETSGF